jgi:hypothetical protein
MNAIFPNRMFESGLGIRSNFFNQRDTSFLGQNVELMAPPTRKISTQGPNDMPTATPGIPKPDTRVMPIPGDRVAYDPQRFEKLLLRLCSIMTKFTESNVDAETKSRFFWSYVREANQPEALVLSTFNQLCPSIPVPAKPTTPDRELKAESPGKAGFHGKTQISYAEAKELLAALDEVLKPFTPEELANDIGREECLRDLAAGNFPIVERLRERLSQFVAAGDSGATFQISAGEMNVTGKAIDCAVALGRGKAIRTAATVGGIGAAGALLLLLL